MAGRRPGAVRSQISRTQKGVASHGELASLLELAALALRTPLKHKHLRKHRGGVAEGCHMSPKGCLRKGGGGAVLSSIFWPEEFPPSFSAELAAWGVCLLLAFPSPLATANPPPRGGGSEGGAPGSHSPHATDGPTPCPAIGLSHWGFCHWGFSHRLSKGRGEGVTHPLMSLAALKTLDLRSFIVI